MPNDRSEIHIAFVDAYPTYVATVLSARGIGVDEILADAIVEGTQVLDGLLTSFDRTPITEQRTSPLELFREALRPVDRALGLVGAPEAVDVPAHHAAWDRYGLVPGSSQVLGEEAHAAHLRWGVEKARAMAPLVNRSDAADRAGDQADARVSDALVSPRVDDSAGDATSDQDGSGLRPAAAVLASTENAPAILARVEQQGYEVVTHGVARVAVAVVDTDLGGVANEAIRRLTADGVHVVAIVAQSDDLVEGGLRALGADRVASLAEFIAEPSAYLPAIT